MKNVGTLPSSSQLQNHYLPKVFDVNHDEFKARVAAASSIVVLTDEASDSQDRFVLHVLFVLPVTSSDETQMEAVTVDLVYLEHVNATTVSQTIIQTLGKFNVDFNKVSACHRQRELHDEGYEQSKGVTSTLCPYDVQCSHSKSGW